MQDDAEKAPVAPVQAETLDLRDMSNYKIGTPSALPLKLLGPGLNCEMEGCTRGAYLICGDNSRVFPYMVCFCAGKVKQCDKRLCD